MNLPLLLKLLPCAYLSILIACGEAPPPYYPSSGGVSPVTAEKPGTQSGSGEVVKGTPVQTPTTVANPPANANKPNANGTKPPAAPPPAPAGGAAPNAALVQQGTQVFTAKCATAGCHAPIAQKATDPRVNGKSAAIITAAKTSKPAPHGPVVWPSATEITAIEAALK